MFGRKNDNQTKVKEPSARDILKGKITNEIEALNPGQAVIYQLSEFYTFARFLGVELNPEFPQKGKKYLMFTDEMADGKPKGKKNYTGSTNKIADIVFWISDRDSDKYGHIKRIQ